VHTEAQRAIFPASAKLATDAERSPLRAGICVFAAFFADIAKMGVVLA